MTKTVIEIPIRLPGLNEYTAQNRRNKFAGAKMKADIERQLVAYITAQKPKRHTRVRIIFRWREENKKRDLDNVAFAKKFILDALVASGVLPNDGWANVVGFEDHFEVSKQPGVRVELEEL